jgi:murein tripeptide amidase MpaA
MMKIILSLPLLFAIIWTSFLSTTVTGSISNTSVSNDHQEPYKSYENFWLLKANVSTEPQRLALAALKKQADHSSDEELKLWTLRSDEVDMLVAPSKQRELIRLLNAAKIPFVLKTDNMGAIINNERIQMTANNYDPARDGLDGYFNDYQDFATTEAWLVALVKSCPPGLCTLKSIGKTGEGRNQWVITIGANPNKKCNYMQANIHAREWITTPTLAWFLYDTIRNYGKTAEATEFIDSYETHAILSVNPDGYSYSRTNDRLWRKNTVRLQGTKCKGVDLNRNWPTHWAEEGASTNPCSLTFAGPSEASELETQNIIRYMKKNLAGRTISFLDVHSYSQVMLRPYGYNTNDPPNTPDLNAAGDAFCNALSQRYGTKYIHGSSSQVLYKVSGGCDDWAYEEMEIAYPYTIECPDKGKYGFVLDKALIRPIALETSDGFNAFFRHIAVRHNFLVDYSAKLPSTRFDGVHQRNAKLSSLNKNQHVSQLNSEQKSKISRNDLLAGLLSSLLGTNGFA